ncbi:MAG: ATP-binding protein [Cyanobacteria bacterium P01_F01_bin.150]
MPISDDLLNDSEALLVEIYSAFEPFQPPPKDAYVNCEEVRGGWDIIRELGKKITLSKNPTCQLYSGHRGVGKSTELGRLKVYLESKKYKVVSFAVDEEDIEPQDAEYADILFACTRKLVEDVKLEKDRNPLVQWIAKRWTAWKDFAQTDVEFDGLTIEQQVSAFRKLSATFKAVPDKRRQMRQNINAETPSLVEALNEFIQNAKEDLAADYPRGLVVIVDNLDRIAETQADKGAPSNYDEIFINRSEMLRGLACHVIYTAPISMIYSERATQLEDRFDTPDVLPMITVRTRENQVNPAGLRKLKELITRRVQTVHPKLVQTLEGSVDGVDIPAVFDSPKSVEDLCIMSGGHVRNLVQLVQKAIEWTDELPISERAVRRAIADARATYLKTIQESQWTLLVTAYKKRDYKRDPDHLRLLLNRCLLEYRDYDEIVGTSETWCNIHPLIEAIPQFQAALKALEAAQNGQSSN